MTSIVLWVSDLNKQSEFYSELLGAEITSSGTDFAAISNEQNKVLLHLLAREFRIESGPVAPLEDVAIKPIFSVRNIEAARESAKNLGALFPREIAEYEGIQYLDCVDPEGNVIQLSN